jgi:hypothetical protein
MADDKDLVQAMRARHSVRQYEDRPVPADVRAELEREVERLNAESGLHIQLFFDEPECFDSARAHYGKFTGVTDYLAIVGPKSPDLDERAGYWCERVVLLAQSLGLNSCWVGMTHGKSHARIGRGEKQAIVVSLGYGKTQGVPHKSRPMEQLCSVAGEMPDWFRRGMEAAMLSPTAVNQQKFLISWDGSRLTAHVRGAGFFASTDLGIVKCDFELASGHRFDA